MNRRHLAAGSLLTVLLLCPAPPAAHGAETSEPGTPPPTSVTITAGAADSDRLRPGDRLRFQIVEDGSPAVDLLIGEDGRVETPYLGFMPAAGLSLETLQAQLVAALEKDYYQKATVRMAVTQRAGKAVNMGRIYIAGEVRRIGQVEVAKSENVLLSQVLLANGGFSDFADLRRVKIFRRNPTGAVETIIVNLRNIIELGRINEDVSVLDGDFILVGSKLVNW